MEQIGALGIKLLDNGGVELEQAVGCGDTATINLHPIHVRYLFERVGYVAPATPESVRVKTLEQRLRWMRDQFLEIDVQLPSDFFERCSDASTFYAWLTSRSFVAGELTDDLSEIEVGQSSPESDLVKSIRQLDLPV